MTSTWAI